MCAVGNGTIRYLPVLSSLRLILCLIQQWSSCRSSQFCYRRSGCRRSFKTHWVYRYLDGMVPTSFLVWMSCDFPTDLCSVVAHRKRDGRLTPWFLTCRKFLWGLFLPAIHVSLLQGIHLAPSNWWTCCNRGRFMYYLFHRHCVFGRLPHTKSTRGPPTILSLWFLSRQHGATPAVCVVSFRRQSRKLLLTSFLGYCMNRSTSQH